MAEALPPIQGKTPDSKEEVWFAFALDKLKVDYIFQYSIYGGTRLRGGLVVDFVCRIPFDVPVEIFGRHWHEGQLGADDKLKLAIERQYFKREPIVIWSDEMKAPEDAERIVRQKLLRR